MTDTHEEPISPRNPSPKHIVFSGGGPSIFTIFGAFKCFVEKGLLDMSSLTSIYACSSGAFLGVCVSLLNSGLTIDEIETYIVSRCWTTLFVNEVLHFNKAFHSKGLFDDTVIKKAITPLMTASGLSQESTLSELYEKTRVKLVMFAVDINSKPLEKVRLSYETFPDLPVYRALQMTMGLPGVISPSFVDGMCLVDGGLLANYPYNDCLNDVRDGGGDCDGNVLGFKIKWEKPRTPIDSSSNIITFFAHLMKMMAIHIDSSSRDLSVEATQNTVECCAPDAGNPAAWVDLFGDSELRANYVASGVSSAERFIEERSQRTQPECHT